VSTEMQFAVGLIAGLIGGIAVGVFRPLAIIIAVGLAIAAAITFHDSGVPGVVGSFRHLADQIWQFAPFFLALGLGKVLGVSIARH
jgi:hypothetical protein